MTVVTDEMVERAADKLASLDDPFSWLSNDDQQDLMRQALAAALSDTGKVEGVECVACEGKPSGENIPCAICGLSPAPVEQQEPVATPAPVLHLGGIVDALRGALEPFARAASDYDAYGVGYVVDHGKLLTVGDLRLAKAAFETPTSGSHVNGMVEQNRKMIARWKEIIEDGPEGNEPLGNVVRKLEQTTDALAALVATAPVSMEVVSR